MIHRCRYAAIVLIFATAPVFAQALEHPTLYRLERDSTFQRGCFPPCMCPIMQTTPVAGTFRLELVTVGDVFDFYEVRGVRWKTHAQNTDLLITGSGTYKVSRAADLQEMRLDLVVGNEPVTVYQTQEVSGGSAFPRIALRLSIHGEFCIDTVIDLRARPAPRLHVDRNLVGWDSNAEVTGATYDLSQGDLGDLRVSEGAFDLATRACLANDVNATQVPFGAPPESGRGFWFLERSTGESFDDEDAMQVGSADPGISASPGACP